MLNLLDQGEGGRENIRFARRGKPPSADAVFPGDKASGFGHICFMSELRRFHDALEGVFELALAELKAGRKMTHWMWFVFPQIRGLGMSAMSRKYGIADLDEARDYLADPELSAMLRSCGEAMLEHRGKSAVEILGETDALKLRSSATLFREAGGGPVFRDLLETFFDGRDCPETVIRLGRSKTGS